MRVKLPCLTPEQVYGVEEVFAPKGYEFTGEWVDANQCPNGTVLMDINGFIAHSCGPTTASRPASRLGLRKVPVRWVPEVGKKYWTVNHGESNVRQRENAPLTKPAWKTFEHAEEFRAALNKLADEFQQRFYGGEA